MAENEKVLHIGKAEFDQTVLKADKPVLVDFWAPWCSPCLMIASTVEQLAEEYDGKVIVAKVNTDEDGEIAQSYGIQGIPTMIFFNNGEEADRITGAVPKQALAAKLDALLG